MDPLNGTTIAVSALHGAGPSQLDGRSVLITGASGLIGRSVLKAFRMSVPAESIVLAGRTGTAQASSGLRYAPLDLAGGGLNLPDGIGTLVHLAGEKGDVNRMDAVNHEGAAHLVEAASRAGVRRFVHLSSVGVYGAPKHSGVVDELHPHVPRNPYEISKDFGERAVLQRCAALGLDCVVLQPSNVLGVVQGRSYPLLGLARTMARGWFRYLGSGEAWVNYVAVEDVASAVMAAARHDAASGVFIVNTPVQLAALVQWTAEELGVSVPTHRIPEWIGAVAASAGKFGPRWLTRRLPLSPERLLELTNTTRFDGAAITRSLDFDYSFGVEAAMRAMLRQYRREGLL